jgi:hypothetical protein
VLRGRVDARRRLREPHAESSSPPIDFARVMAGLTGRPLPSHALPELRKRPQPPNEDRDFGDWDGRKLRANPYVGRAWQQKKSSAEFPAFTGRVTVRRRKIS